MKWLNNLKIAKKLLFGFGIGIVLTIFLAASSAFIVSQIDNRYSDLQTSERDWCWQKMPEGLFAQCRQDRLRMAYNADQVDQAKSAYDTLNSEIANSVNILKPIQDVMNRDTRLEDAKRREATSAIREIINGINVDYRATGDEIIKAIETGCADEVDTIIRGGSASPNKTNQLLDQLIQNTEEEAVLMSAKVSENAKRSIPYS